MQLSIVLSRIEAEETNGSEGRLQTEEKEEEMKRMISGIGEINTGQGKDREKGSGLGWGEEGGTEMEMNRWKRTEE